MSIPDAARQQTQHATPPALSDIGRLLEQAQEDGPDARIFNGLTAEEYAQHFLHLPVGRVDQPTYNNILEMLHSTHPYEERRVFGINYHGRIAAPDLRLIDPLGITHKNEHEILSDDGMVPGSSLMVYFGPHRDGHVIRAIETLENRRQARIYHPRGHLELHL